MNPENSEGVHERLRKSAIFQLRFWIFDLLACALYLGFTVWQRNGLFGYGTLLVALCATPIILAQTLVFIECRLLAGTKWDCSGNRKFCEQQCSYKK